MAVRRERRGVSKAEGQAAAERSESEASKQQREREREKQQRRSRVKATPPNARRCDLLTEASGGGRESKHSHWLDGAVLDRSSHTTRCGMIDRALQLSSSTSGSRACSDRDMRRELKRMEKV